MVNQKFDRYFVYIFITIQKEFLVEFWASTIYIYVVRQPGRHVKVRGSWVRVYHAKDICCYIVHSWEYHQLDTILNSNSNNNNRETRRLEWCAIRQKSLGELSICRLKEDWYFHLRAGFTCAAAVLFFFFVYSFSCNWAIIIYISMPMYESTYLILRYLGVIINLASLYKLDLKRHRTYPLFSVLYSPQFSCGSYNFLLFSRVKSRRKIIRKRASLNINSIYVGIFLGSGRWCTAKQLLFRNN